MCNRHGVVCAPRLGDVRFSSAVCHCSLLFLSSGGLSVHSRMSVHLLKGMAHACEVALPRLGSISAVHIFFPLPSRLLPCLRFGTQLSLRTDLVSTEFLFCRFLLHYCSFDCSLCLLWVSWSLFFSSLLVEASEACLELSPEPPSSAAIPPPCLHPVSLGICSRLFSFDQKHFLIFLSISFTCWLFRSMLVNSGIWRFPRFLSSVYSYLYPMDQSTPFVWFQSFNYETCLMV